MKNALIKELEATLEINDFKKTVAEIKKLQLKWKKIGHAGKHLEQKLWHNFRSKCDEFFDNKSNENKAKKEEELKTINGTDIILIKLPTAVKEIDKATSPLASEVKIFEVTPPGAEAIIMTPIASSGDIGQIFIIINATIGKSII